MNIKYVTGLLCISTVVIAACGGGSNSASTSDDDSNVSPDNGTTSTVDTTDPSSTTDVESQASAGDRICTSHTPTMQSTIGNSVLAFDADPGQCFGVKEAMSSGKRLIEASVIGDSAVASGGVLSAVGDGRLTINPYDNTLGEGITYTFALEVSNSGSQVACIENAYLNNPYALILDAQGEQLGSVRLAMLGDQYQVPAAETPDIFTGCIPAGETRTAIGDWIDVDADADSDVIASYDRVEVSLNAVLLSDDAERAEDLSPVELSWTASALTGEDSLVAGYYPYSVVLSIMNTSTQNVRAASSLEVLYYIDDEGYLIGTEIVSVGDFLGKNNDSVTAAERVLSPVGGTLGFATGDTARITDVDGNPEGYRGPAARVLVHVERCFDEGCTPLGL